jgi:hypothetical protein
MIDNFPTADSGDPDFGIADYFGIRGKVKQCRNEVAVFLGTSGEEGLLVQCHQYEAVKQLVTAICWRTARRAWFSVDSWAGTQGSEK